MRPARFELAASARVFVCDPDYRLANPDALESDVSGKRERFEDACDIRPQPSS